MNKSIFFSFVFCTALLSGCALFEEKGPPPETPPFQIPESAGRKLTPSYLTEKMTDQLSMALVTNALAGKRIRKAALPQGSGEAKLLYDTVQKLAATGLIYLSNDPRDPFFTSRMDKHSWKVTLQSPFPRKILLQQEISFNK